MAYALVADLDADLGKGRGEMVPGPFDNQGATA
jgi:hypothetical protein